MFKGICVCVYNSFSSTAINVVPVLKEVCTGHSLVTTQMTLWMDVKRISITTFSNAIFWISAIVYDRLSNGVRQIER